MGKKRTHRLLAATKVQQHPGPTLQVEVSFFLWTKVVWNWIFFSRSCLGLWRALDWCAAMHPKGTAPDFCFFLLSLLGNERSYQEIPYWQACQSNISLPSIVCFNFLVWNVAMVFSCSGENCECQAGSGPPSRGSATEADQRAAWIFLHQLMLRCCGCGCGSVPKHCSA